MIVTMWAAWYYGLSLSNYIAYCAVLMLVNEAMMQLQNITKDGARLLPEIRLCQPIMAVMPEFKDNRQVVKSITGQMEIRGLKFRYAENMPLLFDGLNLTINSGTMWHLSEVLAAARARFMSGDIVVPGMVQRNRGHIINVGSVAGDAAYAGGNVYCATKAAVKALTDGLRIDVADTAIRVTNLKPGLVETNFSNIRFHGDNDRAANVYKGIQPLTGDDIADVAVYAANAPAHVQIAEVLILATHQASGSVIVKK